MKNLVFIKAQILRLLYLFSELFLYFSSNVFFHDDFG